MKTRVVILSGYSLFAEGVASRLRQCLQLVEFEVMDPRKPSTLSRIAATPPSVVILDSTDPGVVRHCPLGKLLGSAPELEVICLELEQAQIQLVASERHPAANVHDLVGVIDPPI